MKNMKKTMVLIAVGIMLIGMLTGCNVTTEGKALYDAFEKTQTIKSSQNDMEFSLKLDATGLSEQAQLSFEQMKAVLNGAKLSMSMKQIVNSNMESKAEASTSMSMGGMSMNMSVWVDMDLNNSEPRFIEIVKLPAVMAATDPTMAGKEYLVMNLGEMMKSTEADIMKFTADLQEKANVFLAAYMKLYDPGFKYITDAGTKSIATPEGTVKAHLYQIKLDDKSVKKLIRYTVNNLAENKDAMDFATEYINFMQKLTESVASSTSSNSDLDKFMSEFETKKPELLAEFNRYMDKIEDIKLIGDKGINFEYAIDENGFIVSQSGSMDFVIDMAKLKSMGTDNAEGSGVYYVTIDFSMLTYNINKEMTIDMPELTPENSIDYNEMIKAAAEAAVPAKELKAMPTASKVLVNGKAISFDAYTIEGNNYFKLRDLAMSLSGTQKQFDVSWNEEKKIINLISDKAYTVVGGEMSPGDGNEKTAVMNVSVILKDGLELPLNAYTINGNNYFKLRDIGQAFNIGITWDEATGTIGIDTEADYIEP
ncbi:MAG: hypothetical protein GX301_12515 [Gracilibacteraceae bacterium]|nr:hypothetical protein [Gracilibacteraceae bacterium]